MLSFEGEFLNGLKNEKGIDYTKDGKVEFEGEYLNDEKWNGKETFYNEESYEIFVEEYINGEKIEKDFNKNN